MDFLAVVAGGVVRHVRGCFSYSPLEVLPAGPCLPVSPCVPLALTRPWWEMKFFWAGTDSVLTGCGRTLKDAVASCL